jgi:hypothetical protein
MNTAFSSPPPFKVTAPVRPMLEVAVYTPGANVDPARSAEIDAVEGRPAASR